MNSLRTYAGSDLQVRRPSIWKRRHEIRDGETVVGSMASVNLFGTEVTAESTDGTWTIRQKGVWRPVVEVQAQDSDRPIATIPVHAFRQEFSFPLRDRSHETVTLRRNFFATQFVLTGRAGRELVTVAAGPFAFGRAQITISEKAGEYDELPWLVFLTVYFFVTTRESRSHAH